MENSLSYTLFIRDFVENILLSLNMDYRKYIDFNKKDSMLKTKIDYHNIDNTITHIAYNLLINGKQKIYFYEKNNKAIISLNYHKQEKVIGVVTIKFPNKIMNSFKRKRILRQLKKMNYPRSDGYVDSNYSRDSLFIMNLIKDKSDKITKEYLSVNSAEKCTDQYILYREIRKRKYQKTLVNHILDELNKGFHQFLNIKDCDDNIIFLSQSLEELDLLEEELISNKKTSDEVLKILYPGRI